MRQLGGRADSTYDVLTPDMMSGGVQYDFLAPGLRVITGRDRPAETSPGGDLHVSGASVTSRRSDSGGMTAGEHLTTQSMSAEQPSHRSDPDPVCHAPTPSYSAPTPSYSAPTSSYSSSSDTGTSSSSDTGGGGGGCD